MGSRNKPVIRCALAGTGRIGSSLEDDRKREKPASHAGAIFAHPRCRCIGGADPDEEHLREFGRRWRISSASLYSSLEEMLENQPPDILHIASPTESHINLLSTALDYHVPLVILEKPVASEVEEALAILPRIKSSSTRILVNHERRFSADYMHVRRRVEECTYGRLLSLQARLYMGRTKPVKDVLWHDGTHMVDIIRYLCGSNLEALHVQGDPYSSEDNVYLFGKAAGVDVLLDCSPGRDHLHFELELSFEQGRIRVGNGIYQEEKSCPSPYYEVYRSLLPQKKVFKRTGYFRNMMAHAVELFDHQEMQSRSSFEEGIASIRNIQSFLDLAERS